MNIQEAINNYEKSLNELVGFHGQSNDNHNKNFLDSEIRRLTCKIEDLKRSLEPGKEVTKYRLLENYSWEQTKELLKIYLNRSDFLGKDMSKISCKVDLLDGNHTAMIVVENAKLIIKNLSYPLELLESDFVKVTKKFVIVTLKKAVAQDWTSLQKTTSTMSKGDLSDFKPDENEDPSQSMMNLVKKMYNEGDDEMKKMINKAWCTNSFK